MHVPKIKFHPEGIAFWNLNLQETLTYTRLFAVAAWTFGWTLISWLRHVRSAWQLHEDGKVKIGTLAITGTVSELKMLFNGTSRRCGLVALILLSAYVIDYLGGLLMVNATSSHTDCGIERRDSEAQARLIDMTGIQFYNHSGYTNAIETLYSSAKVPSGTIPKLVIHDKYWVYTPDLLGGTITCNNVETPFSFTANVSLGIRSKAFEIPNWTTGANPVGASPVQALHPNVAYSSVRFDLRTGRYIVPCAADPLSNCITHLDLHYLASWPEADTSFNVMLLDIYDTLPSPMDVGRLNGEDFRILYQTQPSVTARVCRVSLDDPAIVSRWGEMNLPYVDRFSAFLADRLTREWNQNVLTALKTKGTPLPPRTNSTDLLTKLVLAIGTDLKPDTFMTPASFAVPCSIVSYPGMLVMLIPTVVCLVLLSYLAYVFSATGRSLQAKLGLIPVSGLEWAGLALKEAGSAPRSDNCADAFEQNCDIWLVEENDTLKLVRGTSAHNEVNLTRIEGEEMLYSKVTV
ncbi:hypothetical protein DFS34DRAFT_686128 [Phlyctochytrium arcticum]|nr:hypothetical protein DFS34DRAFT_686128 [Phlyctochytrium arcticum]